MPHLYDSTNIPNIQFLEQGSTPSTPASTFWRLYFKSGGLYMLDDAGVETQISAWSTAAGLTRLGTTTDNVTVGSAVAGGKIFIDGDADEIQLQVQANATQTALLAVFENSAGNDVLTIAGLGGLVVNEQGNDTDSRIEGDNDANLTVWDASADRVGIGNATPTARLMIDGRADEVQTLIQGHSTQTSNILVVEKSDGSDMLVVSTAGIGFNGAAAWSRATYGAPTGTATRTTFDTATVTLAQLAERVKAMIDDLRTRGDFA